MNVTGVTPNNQTTITVDGDLADWSNVDSFGTDPLDANGLNDTIDWVEGWAAHDAQNFYLAYNNESATSLSWGYGIYIDTDNRTTTGFKGFSSEYPIGVDYLIEGSDIQKYTGTGNNWSWESVSTAAIAFANNNTELAINKSALANAGQLRLFFFGQNSAVGGPTDDFYPDAVTNANATVRFFEYNGQ